MELYENVAMDIVIDPRDDYFDDFFYITKNKILKLVCGNEDCRLDIKIEQGWDDTIIGGSCDICDSTLTFSPGIPQERFGECKITG